MTEIPNEFFKFLAEKLVFVCIFLGGISATALGALVIVKNDSKIFKWMVLFLSLAAVSFIVAVFGMIKVQIVLTEGSPYFEKEGLLMYPRIVGGLSFYLGIYSLLSFIGLAGWVNSKKVGIITTVISVVAGVLILTLT